MRAWIEDGVLYILPTLSEHAAVAALAGQPLAPGPVPIRGVGLAGGFRLLPPLPPTEERP